MSQSEMGNHAKPLSTLRQPGFLEIQWKTHLAQYEGQSVTPITLQASKCLTVYLRQLSIPSQVQPACLCQQKKERKKNIIHRNVVRLESQLWEGHKT